MRKLLNWIKEYWGYAASVIGAVTFISGMAVNIDRKRIKEDVLQTEVREVRSILNEFQDSFKGYVLMSDQRLEGIETALNTLSEEVSQQATNQDVLKKTLMESFAKNPGISKDDYNYLMNILLDIKKNSGLTGLLPIQSGQKE